MGEAALVCESRIPHRDRCIAESQPTIQRVDRFTIRDFGDSQAKQVND